MSNAVMIWWSALCAVAVLNAVGWGYSARMLGRRETNLPRSVYETRRQLLCLAAIYVLGCGFRSAFPLVDVPRICLHDTELSRVFVGRTVATIAELCLAAQFALLLREAGLTTGRRVAMTVSYALVPLIGVAEAASWYAVLTASNLMHAIENSLWTLAAVLGIAGFMDLRAHLDDRGKRFLTALITGGTIYVAFMVTVDVPMYLSRWQLGVAAGQSELSILDGLNQTLSRCSVVRDWAAWREDVPWLSLYFSVAVWISIALPHAPPLRLPSGAATNDRLRPGRPTA